MFAMDAGIVSRPPSEGQQHHYDLHLYTDPNYRGPCERLSLKERQAMLAELMDIADLPDELPLPPYGLPGHNKQPDPVVMEIILDGVRYLRAIAAGERKTLWNIHNRVAEMLKRSYWDGHKRGYAKRSEEVEEGLRAEARLYSKRSIHGDTEAFVYFIQSATGDIKIGMARDVAVRMKTLQTAHPVKLTLLVSCDGGATVEREYHQRFAEHRRHGEWFDPHPDILAEIERLQFKQRNEA